MCLRAPLSALFLAIILIIFLAGCAVTPDTKPDSSAADKNPDLAWSQHAEQIRQLDVWRIDGRIGVRQDQQAWHAGLDWSQTKTIYRIDLLSPLGNKLAQFSGSEDGIYVTTSKGQTSFAETPEALMSELVGFSLPLAGMQYWVRGLPEPDVSHQRLKLNRDGRLSQLTQSGWEVDYLHYQTVKDVYLPGKIKLYHEDISITVVIKDWELPGTEL